MVISLQDEISPHLYLLVVLDIWCSYDPTIPQQMSASRSEKNRQKYGFVIEYFRRHILNASISEENLLNNALEIRRNRIQYIVNKSEI